MIASFCLLTASHFSPPFSLARSIRLVLSLNIKLPVIKWGEVEKFNSCPDYGKLVPTAGRFSAWLSLARSIRLVPCFWLAGLKLAVLRDGLLGKLFGVTI